MSENKAKKLFNSVTNISDDIIEEAQTGKAHKKTYTWVKWGTVAACLCLIAVGIFAAIGNEDEPDIPTIFPGTVVIAAEDIVWGGGFGSVGTTNYETRRFDGDEGIPVSPVKDNADVEALSVYRSLNAQNSNETYELLLSWAEELSEQAKENFGIDLEFSKEAENILMNKEKYDSDAPLSDQYMYYLSTKLYYEDVVLTLSCVSEGNVTFYDLDGIGELYKVVAKEPFPVLENPTDEELVAATGPIVSFVNELTGKNYSLEPYSISRKERKDVTSIGLYIGQTNAFGNELSKQMFVEMRGSLSIGLIADENGAFQLGGASIMEDYYEYIGEYELISLSEAEEYLHKGYTFGGVQCPVCKASANNPAVDFSEYDLVQVEYYSNLMEFALPYYAFYKHIETGEYPDGEGAYEDYAVTYVPAIRVEGLEEYFKEQETQHEETGHSLQP